MHLAVFASGRGSNMLAIADAIGEGRLLEVSLSLLVCDQPGAQVLDHAKCLGLNSFVFEASQYSDKLAYESEILRRLEQHKIDLVVLAGYMRIISPVLLEVWEGRMINLHPSLLPSFPGKDGIGDAFRSGVCETGVTVHFVDPGIDTGPIISQRTVKIDPEDSETTLAQKIHLVEHQLLPEIIDHIAKEGIVKVRNQALIGPITPRTIYSR